MTEPPTSSPLSLIVPGGRQETTVVSDKARAHAIATLAIGLNNDDIFEAIRIQGGSLETTITPGAPKNTKFNPVTQLDRDNSSAKYNAGSIGLIKEILTFPQSAVVGDLIWSTSFEYSFASYPKFVSHIRESRVQLTTLLYNEFQT